MTQQTTDPQPAADDLGFELPAPTHRSRATVLMLIAALAGGAFAFGYFQHKKAHGAGPISEGDAGPVRVEVVRPELMSSDQAISLPGSVKALEEAKIYSRSSGYVRRWLVDIGDKVKEGQLLAEIETPELDAQLAQARAQLASARANVKQAIAARDYSKTNGARYETLADQKLVSRADVEQKQSQAATDEATVAAADSNVVAQEANVRRLQDLQGFAKVTAPFAGTITSRTVERGNLVGEAGGTPMFTLVATDPVRIFIDVPQNVAPHIRVGTDAAVTVREYAGRTFTGKVTRTAGALDPDLHVMSTEVQVPNGDNALLPGMYVQVAINLPVPHHVLAVPATALYSDALGLRVATVDAQQRVKLVPITIERDTGPTLWIATGITETDRVLKIAIPTLVDGDPVEVAQPTKPAAAAPAAPGSQGSQGSGQKSSP